MPAALLFFMLFLGRRNCTLNMWESRRGKQVNLFIINKTRETQSGRVSKSLLYQRTVGQHKLVLLIRLWQALSFAYQDWCEVHASLSGVLMDSTGAYTESERQGVADLLRHRREKPKNCLISLVIVEITRSHSSSLSGRWSERRASSLDKALTWLKAKFEVNI